MKLKKPLVVVSLDPLFVAVGTGVREETGAEETARVKVRVALAELAGAEDRTAELKGLPEVS